MLGLLLLSSNQRGSSGLTRVLVAKRLAPRTLGSALAATSPLFRKNDNHDTELQQAIGITDEPVRNRRWSFMPIQVDAEGGAVIRPTSTIRWWRRALEAYDKQLYEKPILTKSVTSAVILALGDIVAQMIETTGPFALNRARLWGFILAGLVFEGPWLHFWYEKLDR